MRRSGLLRFIGAWHFHAAQNRCLFGRRRRAIGIGQFDLQVAVHAYASELDSHLLGAGVVLSVRDSQNSVIRLPLQLFHPNRLPAVAGRGGCSLAPWVRRSSVICLSPQYGTTVGEVRRWALWVFKGRRAEDHKISFSPSLLKN